MNWRRQLATSLALVGLALAALPAAAQKPIRIGYPVILSGPGALIGEPSLKGAQMFVEEINAKGGVLGRKIELVVRDTKGNADEAVRIARDLILRENVDFLVGTLTSAEGPAVSPVAKENKIVFVVPVVKTDQLTAPANLHPYVFRTATTTTIEGRTAAEIMAKWQVKRVATMSPDYAFGQDLTQAFVTHLKKIRPDIEIVDQQWPKLGEADYTPFINAQLAKKPDAVFTSLWGGHFVTFVKQAKPLRYFESVKFNVLAAGEAGAIETTKAMGDDYPVGIWANAYDAFNWDGPPDPQGVHQAPARLPEGRASVVVADHRLHRHADADGGDRQGGKHGFGQGRQGDARDHRRHADRQAELPGQGPPGQPGAVLGQDGEGSALSVRGDEPADLHRSDARSWIDRGECQADDRRRGPSPMPSRASSKVLDILEHLGAARRPVSVSDIARATGFNVSTAFRQVQTLVARGYVEQEPGHRSYVLGPRVYQLASAYLKGNDLAALARPHLEALRDVVGETVYLVILSQGEIVQLCKADGQQVVSASIRSAQREPAYCTATGKVLLSGLAPEALERYLSAVRLRPIPPQTITSRVEARARDRRRPQGGLRARRRGVRREPVLRQRPGARSEQRARLSLRSASPCRRSASSAASSRAGAGSWRRRPRSSRRSSA